MESLRFLLTARAQLVNALTALGNSLTSLLVTVPGHGWGQVPRPAAAEARRQAGCQPLRRAFGLPSRPSSPCANSPRPNNTPNARPTTSNTGCTSCSASTVRRCWPSTEPRPQWPRIWWSLPVATPERIRDEAVFANLCGTARPSRPPPDQPIQAA